MACTVTTTAVVDRGNFTGPSSINSRPIFGARFQRPSLSPRAPPRHFPSPFSRHHESDSLTISSPFPFPKTLTLPPQSRPPLRSRPPIRRFPLLLPNTPTFGLLESTAEVVAMENDAAVAAYERALEAREPRQLGFRFRLPRLRNPRLRDAADLAAWGVAGLLFTTVPDLAANWDHVLLYFILLMAGVLLLLLAVAAPDLDVAERAAGRLEGWIRAMLFRGA